MRVLIVGGGICGLGTALLLARDGHITPVQEILERPEVVQRLAAAREAMKGIAPPGPLLGPTRDQLLQIVA